MAVVGMGTAAVVAEASAADVEIEVLVGRDVMFACAQVDPLVGSLVAQATAQHRLATDSVCGLVGRS